MARQSELNAKKVELDQLLAKVGGRRLEILERLLAEARQTTPPAERPEFGWHSGIEAKPDVVKWVQVDLGSPRKIARIVYVGCHDDFNNIGAGFGFPVRYKVEISDDAEFKKSVTVADHTAADVHNPGVKPQSVEVGGKKARYVRVTATRLAPRSGDYIFALAELSVLTPQGPQLMGNFLKLDKPLRGD